MTPKGQKDRRHKDENIIPRLAKGQSPGLVTKGEKQVFCWGGGAVGKVNM